jgi:hypothetical protein
MLAISVCSVDQITAGYRIISIISRLLILKTAHMRSMFSRDIHDFRNLS